MADDFQYIKGTPPPICLPAKNYIFKLDGNHYMIEIPRKGTYHELAPELFTEEDGEFNIFDEESKILYMPAVTKVLFAMSKYPDLNFNQFFVPYSYKFEEDKVVIVGQVVDLILGERPAEQEEAPEEGEE